jgi:hypothetical protein
LKNWKIKIELPIEIRKKGKQWAKLIYSTILQPEQWIQVKIEVPKGKLDMIWKIETSRNKS